jgi:hypothetical protein
MIKTEGVFYKKATGKIFFTCLDGEAIRTIINEAIVTKEAKTITCVSTGVNTKGENVAQFYFTWSFKVRA